MDVAAPPLPAVPPAPTVIVWGVVTLPRKKNSRTSPPPPPPPLTVDPPAPLPPPPPTTSAAKICRPEVEGVHVPPVRKVCGAATPCARMIASTLVVPTRVRKPPEMITSAPTATAVFGTSSPAAVCTKASVASFVVLSPVVCVVAATPLGNVGVPERLAAVPLVF
jgi:hypothetical protein